MKINFLQVLLGLAFMVPVAANAADGGGGTPDLLVLKMADATTAEFKLAEQPIVSFADGKLKVESGSMTVDYDQAAVEEFYFKADDGTGVGKTEAGKFSFTYNDNVHVVISGTQASKLTVNTIDGKLLKTQSVKGGNATVSLEGYSAGVYVIGFENGNTFKIVKK